MIKAMIQEFLSYETNNKGLAAQTIEGYAKALKAFTRWAFPQGLRWSQISPADMDRFVSEQYAAGLQPRTIKQRVEVVRLLYSWANHKGLLSQNPARYTQTPKALKTLPKDADETKILRLLSQQATSRDMIIVQAITALIYDTGMRIGEITDLRGEDIDTEKRSILVRGKGGKERYVYYGEHAASYCEMMHNRRGYIFSETQEQLRYMMYRFLPGTHPHMIRHLFAVRMLNNGMRLKTLSTLMGHTSVKTSEIYAHMLTEQMREEYIKAS